MQNGWMCNIAKMKEGFEERATSARKS